MPFLTLDLAGHEFAVRSVRGRTALSELFDFEVHATIDELPALSDLVGQPFTLAIHDAFERVLTLRGVSLAAERMAAEAGGAVVLSLGPEAARLTVGQDSRIFQEMSAVDAIKKVIEAGGVAADGVRWSLSGSYEARPYIAQYRESDWAFIERLLAEEGIYYWFEHTDDATTLVFADDSTAAPPLEGGAEIPYHDDDALRATSDSVIRVARKVSLVHDAVRLRDYNFDKPRLKLDSKAGSGKLELYDCPGRFPAPPAGDARAKVRLEALRKGGVQVSGETTSTRVRSGLVLELAQHPVEALNASYLADVVIYEARDPRHESGVVESLRIKWIAIPSDTPYRAARARVTETTGGPQTGVVVGAAGEEIHPDATGRVRVQFYWDREGKRDDKASTWMRVGQFPLGGSMILPRVGWDLLVAFHEDDVDAPFVTSHLYDGELRVPYPLPANKTRTAWQTGTTPGGGSVNEIRFEDKGGAEEMFLNASKDMNVVIGDAKDEKVAVDLTHNIGSNHEIKVGDSAKVVVGAKQDVTIGASESLTIGGNREVNVAGSETATIGGSRSVTAIMGTSLDADGGRTLTVGGSMMSIAALEVSRAVLGSLNVTVGSAWISAAATGLANMTGGAAAETVGGAKIYLGGSGCATGVKGAAAETVGGAYAIAAGSNVSEAASGTLAITVGGAFLGNAPSIEIEADSEISVRVGGSSMTIKSSSVEIKAPSLLSPGATIDKGASQIHHN